MAVSVAVVAECLSRHSADVHENDNESYAKNKRLKSSRKKKFATVDQIIDRFLDVGFGGDWGEVSRKDGAMHGDAIGYATETVRESVDGDWNDSCNVRMGDIRRDGAGTCELSGSKASKLIPTQTFGYERKENSVKS